LKFDIGAFTKGKPSNWKGKHPTKESREKMRISHLGQVPVTKGKDCPQFQGANNGMWKGGKTPLSVLIRQLREYREWRSDVYHRDRFACQHCGNNQGGNLNPHHIKAFSMIMDKYNIKSLEEARKCEELWDINNGVTLCIDCHIKIHGKRRVS
jgi:hypothetical protein